MHLFVYGTLMDPEFMTRVTGARHRSQKATLPGYVRKLVRGKVYPAIIGQTDGSVDGIVYYNVSSAAFDRLDNFEGSLYTRTRVDVDGDDGNRVTAYTYVITASSAHRLSNDDWSYETFLQNHKSLFKR